MNTFVYLGLLFFPLVIASFPLFEIKKTIEHFSEQWRNFLGFVIFGSIGLWLTCFLVLGTSNSFNLVLPCSISAGYFLLLLFVVTMGHLLYERKIIREAKVYQTKKPVISNNKLLVVSEMSTSKTDKLWQAYQKTDARKFWKEYNQLIAEAKSNQVTIIKAK